MEFQGGIEAVGTAVDVAGVLVIVVGALVATVVFGYRLLRRSDLYPLAALPRVLFRIFQGGDGGHVDADERSRACRAAAEGAGGRPEADAVKGRCGILLRAGTSDRSVLGWTVPAVRRPWEGPTMIRRLAPPRARKAAVGVWARLSWPRDLTPASPPPCAAGQEIGPPDFVGVGVQKAGTSWWHQLISAHPCCHVVPGQRKELHFFDSAWDQRVRGVDPESYARFFPRPPGMIAGEWTPRYMADFWVPPLLARAAPDARILVLLRDPVTRFESGIRHEVAHHAPRRPVIVADAAARGFYHRQLTGLLRHFPREQLLVLQYERCVQNPKEQLRRTYSFLGLDPDFVPPDLGRIVNVSTGTPFRLSASVRTELVETYTADVLALAADFPDLDLDLWTCFTGQLA